MSERQLESIICAHSNIAVTEGDKAMAQDPTHFLNELPIWKLKIVAEVFNIDVSTCRYKRDYVEKVRSKRLTEEQVRTALASKETKAQKEGGPAADVKAVAKDIEQIASRPAETPELPSEEQKNVERNLDETLAVRPSFFDVDSAFQSAYNRMILGDFYGAMKINRDTRMLCLGTFSNAQVFSAAITIRAADELIAKLTEGRHPAGPGLKTALASAKKAFMDGPPRQREASLESLEMLVEKAYEAFAQETESAESELKALLADYESFGTRTEEARRYLEIASQAKASFNIGEYAKFLEEAKARAEGAKAVREKEIDEGFSLVKAGTEEAREIGAQMGSADADMGEARKALDEGSFKMALELLSRVERSVDEAHLAQIRAQRDLEAKHVEKVNSIIGSYEPMLMEASSYGMGVQNGLYHAASAKAALGSRDVVKAVKHARRLKEVAVPIEKDLDLKRLELGIVRHVEGVKCSACGQESLYLHPNGTEKCFECGQSFQVPTVKPVRLEPPHAEQPTRPVEGPPSPPVAPQPSPAQPGTVPVREPEKKKSRRLFKW